MEPELYYVPSQKHWGCWVFVLCCKNCGQVTSVVELTHTADDKTGCLSIKAENEKAFAACPACGNVSPAERTQGERKRFTLFVYIIDGVAMFSSLQVWYKPWTWGTGYWKLHPKTQHHIHPMSPVEMLAASLDSEGKNP